MGEVDDDAEWLAEVDPLHPPGHDRERREAVADRCRVEPDRLAERDDRERVVGVEPADQLELERGRARRRVVRDAEAAAVLLDPRGADVGRRVRAVGQDAGAGLLGDPDEGAGRRVVGVDDPGRRPGERLCVRVREELEQAQFRVPIRLPRPVQLEVLVGQVRQDRDVVGDLVDAVEGESVRCRFDDRGTVAGTDHRGEGVLEGGCLGGRRVFDVGDLDAADPGGGRAGHPGPDAGRLERRDREERGRRLAVRAGDPDDRQIVARVAVPPRGGRREPDARVRRRPVVEGRRRGAASRRARRRRRQRRRPRRSRGRRRGCRGPPRTATRRGRRASRG